MDDRCVKCFRMTPENQKEAAEAAEAKAQNITRAAKPAKYTSVHVDTRYFPSKEANRGPMPCYLTSLCYCELHGLYFAAAADGALKVYDEKMDIVSTVSWKLDAVLTIAFDNKRDRLVTAGASGVDCWSCIGETPPLLDDDPDAAIRRDRWLRSFQGVSWRYGKYAELRREHHLHLPGVKRDGKWCDTIHLPKNGDWVFAAVRSDVYVFDLDTGNMLHTFADLHTSSITCIAWQHDVGMMLTGSMAGEAKAWRLALTSSRRDPSKPLDMSHATWNLVHAGDIGKYSAPLAAVTLHPGEKDVYTVSRDGSIELWDLATCTSTYRMKLGTKGEDSNLPRGAKQHLAEVSCFLPMNGPFSLVAFGTDVLCLRLVRLSRKLALFSSPITRMSDTSGGRENSECKLVHGDVVRLEHEDGTLRLVSSSGDVISTMGPQPSTRSLLDTSLDEITGDVYARLTDYSVHIWSTRTPDNTRYLERGEHLAHWISASTVMRPVAFATYRAPEPAFLDRSMSRLSTASGGFSSPGETWGRSPSPTTPQPSSPPSKMLSPSPTQMSSPEDNAGDDNSFEEDDDTTTLVLASGSSTGDMYIFDAHDPLHNVVRRVQCHRNTPILFVAGVPELGLVVTACESEVRSWDWGTFQLRMRCALHEPFSRGAILVVSPGSLPNVQASSHHTFGRKRASGGAMNAQLVLGGTRGSVRTIDLRMGQVSPTSCSLDGNRRAFFSSALPGDHLGPVVALAVSPRLFRFASAGADGTVSVFDGERNLLRSLTLAEPARCVAFSPQHNGDVFVSLGGSLEVVPHWTFQDASSLLGFAPEAEDIASQLERVDKESFVEARGSVSEMLPWGGSLARAKEQNKINALSPLRDADAVNEAEERAVAPSRPWQPNRPYESGSVPLEDIPGIDIEPELLPDISALDLWKRVGEEQKKAAKKRAKEDRRKRRVERKQKSWVPTEVALRRSSIPTIREAIQEYTGEQSLVVRSATSLGVLESKKKKKNGGGGGGGGGLPQV